MRTIYSYSFKMSNSLSTAFHITCIDRLWNDCEPPETYCSAGPQHPKFATGQGLQRRIHTDNCQKSFM